MLNLFNRNLKAHSEKVFEGIAGGRKKALENWFNDIWVALELTRDSIVTYLDSAEVDHDEIINMLKEKRNQFKDFSELFIINQEGIVNISTYEGHIKKDLSFLPNYNAGLNNKHLMYGPYVDNATLQIGNFNSKFKDEVTLMFSLPLDYKAAGRKAILCGRVPNDVMSDIIQDEDTHIYKESGDNYLFMVKSNRGIAPGTAISRSRFEDDTFTLGDNLKQGVKTKKYGTIKIQKHTEFEIIFNDPATNSLHVGVRNTIQNGENLDCSPGYNDYRHIMVGGKGTTIKPPHCEEVWGMMCEGDIAEIYKFTSLDLKIPLLSGIISGTLLFGNHILSYISNSMVLPRLVLIWLLITGSLVYIVKRYVTKPLDTTISILQEIAEGEGDLTMRVDKLSMDEIGELSRWFNKFINNQMSLVKRMGRASEDSRNSSHHLSELTENVKENTNVIEKSVSRFVESSQSQNEIFQSTQEKISIISDSIDDINNLINQVRSKTHETNEYATDKANNSKEALAIMNELESKMKISLNGIIELQNFSSKISDVTDVIQNISNQTHLLSLNASIESARAGEAGKGFAVVAQEVSKLAIESSEAAVSISKLISAVQKNTESTINNVKEVGAKVYEESESVKASVEAFTKIQGFINDVTENINSISTLVNTQLNEITQIKLKTQEVADKLNKDTLRNANRSETALELVQSILSQTTQVEQAAKVLTHSSDNLSGIVNAFKVK
ncbi:MAG: methyl-accepting chemotaxis protein [Clostridiaceae bacterium]